MALPAVDALAAESANQSVLVIAGTHSATVFSQRKTVDEVVHCPERTSSGHALAWTRLLRSLEPYDRLVVLDRSRILRMASVVSKTRLRFQLQHVVNETRHESEIYLDLVRSMGIRVSASIPRITPCPASVERAERLVAPGDVFALIHPGGGVNPGATMLNKRWPLDRFVTVARWLERQGLRVVLSGSLGERPLCDEIVHQARVANGTVVAGETDLMTTAALAQRAAIYIGSDTGMSHVAAAVGAPVVVLFGPTNPNRYRPIGERVTVLSPPESTAIADIDLRKHPQAMSKVSVSEVTAARVIEAAESVLAQSTNANWDG